jgi:hypothetical protein
MSLSNLKKIFGGGGRKSREEDQRASDSDIKSIGAPTDVKRNIHVERTKDGYVLVAFLKGLPFTHIYFLMTATRFGTLKNDMSGSRSEMTPLQMNI